MFGMFEGKWEDVMSEKEKICWGGGFIFTWIYSMFVYVCANKTVV